jgi:hypothetical protein
LEFCARPLAAFSRKSGRYRSVELHAVGTFIGNVPGEVSHSQPKYAMPPRLAADYESMSKRRSRKRLKMRKRSPLGVTR